MQKVICNICGKEIPKGAMAGGLMRAREEYPMTSLPKGFNVPGSEGKNAIIEKKIAHDIWDLCTDCSRAIWLVAISRQKEMEGKKDVRPGGMPESILVKK